MGALLRRRGVGEVIQEDRQPREGFRFVEGEFRATIPDRIEAPNRYNQGAMAGHSK